jgi:hypothetical protein
MQRQILRIKIYVREGPPSPACHAAGQRLWARLLGSAISSKPLSDKTCEDRLHRPQPGAESRSRTQRRGNDAVIEDFTNGSPID